MSFFAHLPGGIRKVLVFYQTLLKMDACNHCASVYMYFMATCKARQTLLTQSCKLQKISQMNMKRKFPTRHLLMISWPHYSSIAVWQCVSAYAYLCSLLHLLRFGSGDRWIMKSLSLVCQCLFVKTAFMRTLL